MAAVRSITYVILGLGAIFTLGEMMGDAEWKSLFIVGLILWTIAPYLALTLLNALSKGSAALAWISFVGAVAAVALDVYVCVYIRLHPDPLGALGFVFVPLFQLAWTALLFVPWIFIAVRRRFINAAGAGQVKIEDHRWSQD